MEKGFSQSAVKILDAAHIKAKRDRALRISVYNVLVALLEDSSLQKSFATLGIDRRKARKLFKSEQFKQHLEKASKPPSGTEFTTGVKDALEEALRKAASQERNAEAVDILYGILRTANKLGSLFEILEIPDDTDIESLYSDKASIVS